MAKVFLDYDQAALDAAYDQAAYAPNRDQVLARFARASELVRRRLGAPERLQYGSAALEALDGYRTAKPNAPIVVLGHGRAGGGGMARGHSVPGGRGLHAGAPHAVLGFHH